MGVSAFLDALFEQIDGNVVVTLRQYPWRCPMKHTGRKAG